MGNERKCLRPLGPLHASSLVRIGLMAFALSILSWTQGGFAQQMHIPDSVSLTDVRFFKDKEAGRLYNEAFSYHGTDPLGQLELFDSAYSHARIHLDFEAQGVAGAMVAVRHMSQGEVGEAFDWVNRVLLLDSLMEPLSPLRQRMHREIAGIYSTFEAHRLALAHFKIGFAIDQQRNPTPTARRYRFCSDLAICFQKMGQMDSAFHYYHRAIAIASSLRNEPIWEPAALNNYGMALQSVGKVDSALAVFQNAYQILVASDAPDFGFALSVRDNMGEALLQLGRPEEAYAMFEANFKDFVVRPNVGAHLQAGINMVRSLVAQERGEEARKLLSEMQSFAEGAPQGVQDRYHRELLNAEIIVAELSGAWERASKLQSELIAYDDSLRGNAFKVKVGTLEGMLIDKTAHFKTELGLTRQTAAEAKAVARFQTLLMLSVALLAILLLTVVLINYRRRSEQVKARHQEELFRRELAELGLQNERLENSQLTQQLEMKKRDITDYALVYSQRRKIFEELLEDLRQIKRSPTPEKSLQELIITIKGKMDGEGKLNLEAKNIEKVNHAFYDQLKQRFPALGASELDLCGMIRLGYSAKDIAALRNIAPASVRIAKTRAKKKMGLGPEEDLEEFLSTF